MKFLSLTTMSVASFSVELDGWKSKRNGRNYTPCRMTRESLRQVKLNKENRISFGLVETEYYVYTVAILSRRAGNW